MKKILLVTCCWLLAFCGFAQQRTVTGTVTDGSDGSGLPGVSILVKGSSGGTVTNTNGTFSISVLSSDVLTFSFIGYETQEISVGEQTTITVTMNASASTLSEVVVIGYGTREKRDLTGSYSTVNSKDIENTPFASPQFALQGRASGVRVLPASGNPSEPPKIYVRGIGTWNGAAQPLYVIDGQIITTPTNANQDVIGNINLWTLINPNDIESMSVLKDASATAIYGAAGGNGVILITTKRGKKGKPVVEFNVQYGTQNIATYDVLNRSQFVTLSREMYTNSANPDITLEDDLYGRNATTEEGLLNSYHPQFDPTSPYFLGETGPAYDWQDAARNKNAASANYSVKVSGGGESADYYLSLGYTKQESVLKGNDLERFNLAFNLNTDVGKYIRAGLNYKIAYQEADDYAPADMVGSSQAPPWQPIYDANNQFGYAPSRNLYFVPGSFTPVKLYGEQTRENWLAYLEMNDSQFNLLRNTAQAYLTLEPLKGLTIRGSINLDYAYQQRVSFEDIAGVEFSVTRTDPAVSNPTGSYGNYGLRTNKFFNYQADLTINYVKNFGSHSIDVMLNGQDQNFQNWTEDVSTNNAQSRDRDRLGVQGSSGQIGGFSGKSRQYVFGYVGRISYNFQKKYYLDASGRRDASAGFPKDNRWANFFSFSGAWRISDEAFMKDVIPFLNDLKFRGGWGQAGNDEAVRGAYAYLSTITNSGSYSFGSGDGDAVGNYYIAAALRGFPNEDLKWETITSTNVGFDALLFNSKVSVSAEYFNRRTDDILQTVQLPLSVGTDDPTFNIGSLINRGAEVQVGYDGNFGDFTFGISGNITFLKNEVLELYNDQPLVVGDDVRVEEGRSIDHIWGYQLGGIFQNQGEIDAYYAGVPDETIQGTVDFVRPGDMYFLDVYGNPTSEEPFYSATPDGRITNYDQTEIGKTIPGFTYGLNLTAGYKGLDLTLNFYGEGDVDKVNTARQALEGMHAGGLNYSATTLNRWTEQNHSNSMPRAVAGDPAGNNRFSSRWVESASYFRLNTWQLGYTLPQSIIGKTGGVVNRFRLYIGGQNNMLITNYSGLDPVNDAYPLPKSFFVGANLTF